MPTGDFSLFGFLLREIGVGPWRMQDYGLAALDVVGLGGDFVGVLHKTPFKECGQCTIHPPAFASCSESHTALRAAGCVTSTAYVANVAHIRIAQAVMTIADTPLKHLQIVAGQYERHKDFCFKVSISDSYWSQLRRTGKTRKSLGNRLARDPELALGSLSDFWMRTRSSSGASVDISAEVMSLASAIQAPPPAIRKAFFQPVLTVVFGQQPVPGAN